MDRVGRTGVFHKMDKIVTKKSISLKGAMRQSEVLTFTDYKLESSIMNLSPREISPAFVEHIESHRVSVTQLSEPVLFKYARDWCVDGLHTNVFGNKTGLYGVEVAGAGIRRVSHNDLSLETPYEFMQRIAGQMPDGKKQRVVYSAHRFCGELFIHGAVTKKEQNGEVESAWKTWESDYNRLPGSDKSRVSLGKDIGGRGSAPLLDQHWLSGRLMIANPDYLNNTNDIAGSYPLTEGVWKRLLGEHREKLEAQEVIFSRE